MDSKPPAEPNDSWQFNPNDSATAVQTAPQPEAMSPRSVAVPPTGASGAISWTASEFVVHHKSTGWYALLMGGAVGVAVLVWFLTKDVVSAIVIVVAAAMLASFAARQPRDLVYGLDEIGLMIGEKYFDYGQFRSFAVMTEGAFASIVFTPLKRFAPLTTIYYDPRDEEKIVSLLSDRLPYEERKHDPIERLMWRIRF